MQSANAKQVPITSLDFELILISNIKLHYTKNLVASSYTANIKFVQYALYSIQNVCVGTTPYRVDVCSMTVHYT